MNIKIHYSQAYIMNSNNLELLKHYFSTITLRYNTTVREA